MKKFIRESLDDYLLEARGQKGVISPEDFQIILDILQKSGATKSDIQWTARQIKNTYDVQKGPKTTPPVDDTEVEESPVKPAEVQSEVKPGKRYNVIRGKKYLGPKRYHNEKRKFFREYYPDQFIVVMDSNGEFEDRKTAVAVAKKKNETDKKARSGRYGAEKIDWYR